MRVWNERLSEKNHNYPSSLSWCVDRLTEERERNQTGKRQDQADEICLMHFNFYFSISILDFYSSKNIKTSLKKQHLYDNTSWLNSKQIQLIQINSFFTNLTKFSKDYAQNML